MFSYGTVLPPSPLQPPGRRRGGPVHIRDVIPDALERLSAKRDRPGDAGATLELSARVRLPTYSNAA